MFLCVCMYVYVYCVCDATASFFCRCNCAIRYILDEAMYTCIDAIGLHTLHLAWLPLLRPGSHSRVIKTYYSYVYPHTLQMHHTRQTTRFAQPDRSINHRQNHDERLELKIISRLQRLQKWWLELRREFDKIGMRRFYNVT